MEACCKVKADKRIIVCTMLKSNETKCFALYIANILFDSCIRMAHGEHKK